MRWRREERKNKLDPHMKKPPILFGGLSENLNLHSFLRVGGWFSGYGIWILNGLHLNWIDQKYRSF